MTWIPDTPPAATWARDSATVATWPRDPVPNATWDAGSGADLQRITEDTIRRVTEDGSTIRIIERFRLAWTVPSPPFATWE